MLQDILFYKKITTDIFINLVKHVYKNKYDYSKTIYVNPYTKIIIICPIHGEFLRTPLFYIAGFGCPHCKTHININKRASNIFYRNNNDILLTETQKFKEKAIRLYGQKYNYSKTKYVNVNTEVIIICKKHGEFKQRPKYFLQIINGHPRGGCPDCKTENAPNYKIPPPILSKGEIKIKEWLCYNNIRFKMQKKFQGLLNRKTKHRKRSSLRIDFFLPDYKLLIEYDGQQHFKYSNNGWNTKKHYQRLSQNDRIKNNYCRRNNLRLYRIHYEDFKNIERILYDLIINCRQPRLIGSSKFISESKNKTILEEAGVLINN